MRLNCTLSFIICHHPLDCLSILITVSYTHLAHVHKLSESKIIISKHEPAIRIGHWRERDHYTCTQFSSFSCGVYFHTQKSTPKNQFSLSIWLARWTFLSSVSIWICPDDVEVATVALSGCFKIWYGVYNSVCFEQRPYDTKPNTDRNVKSRIEIG